MKKFNNKLLKSILMLVVASSFVIFKLEVIAEDRTTQFNLSGSYFNEGRDLILERINEIRQEACNEGVIFNGKPLESKQYIPIKWSKELEKISRLRAAEASLNFSHQRPNGKMFYTIQPSGGVRQASEILAWQYGNTILAGIENWYREKAFMPGAELEGKGQTGHYKALINPAFTFIGLSGFDADFDTPYNVNTVAGSLGTGLNVDNDLYGGYTKQQINIEASASTLQPIDVKESITIMAGANKSMNLIGKWLFKGQLGKRWYNTLIHKIDNSLFTWSSNNPNIANVDSDGVIVGISGGTTTIEGRLGESRVRVEVKVLGAIKASTLMDIDGKTYFITENNKLYKGDFFKYLDKLYYADNSGVVVRDTWNYANGKYYYSTKSGEILINEFFESKDGKYYHTDTWGAVENNKWHKINNKTYYSTEGGTIVRDDFFLAANRKLYKSDKSGAVENSTWNQVNGKYYFSTNTGAIMKNDFFKANDEKVYYSDGWGAVQYNRWIFISGRKYYATHTGEIIRSGWFEVNGRWYQTDDWGAVK